MKVTIKKIKIVDLEIIQFELLELIRYTVAHISDEKDYQSYCHAIIVIDTLQGMFYIFRTKRESQKQVSNLTLTPTKAVILHLCCLWKREERTQEQRITMQLLSDELHQKLINI